MRSSIALACFLSGMIAGLLPAQCPQTHRRCCTVAPVRSCASPSASPSQPAYTHTSYCPTSANCPTIAQTSPCVRSYPAAQRYPAVQSCTVAQGLTTSSTQHWSMVPQPQVTAAHAIAGQTAQPNPQNNCNCSGGGATFQKSMPQAGPQTASILERQRNPFSLAGHALPCEGNGIQHCLLEFLTCCENGGQDCMINYVNCTQITGEPLRHSYCPSAAPASDDRVP